MKIGDKVACIDNTEYRLELYKNYTIRVIAVDALTNYQTYLQIDNFNNYFNINKFLTILEYRKQKLLKLKKPRFLRVFAFHIQSNSSSSSCITGSYLSPNSLILS